MKNSNTVILKNNHPFKFYFNGIPIRFTFHGNTINKRKIYFIGKDVCKALGVKNHKKSLKKLSKYQYTYISTFKCIDISGFNTLTFFSTKKEAIYLQHYTNSFIIPMIYKNLYKYDVLSLVCNTYNKVKIGELINMNNKDVNKLLYKLNYLKEKIRYSKTQGKFVFYKCITDKKKMFISKIPIGKQYSDGEEIYQLKYGTILVDHLKNEMECKTWPKI